MNEQLQKELVTWLVNVRTLAEQGKDFVLEQAPLVIQEKILWARAVETFWCISAFVLTVLAIRTLPKVWKWAREKEADTDFNGCFYPVSGLYTVGTIVLTLGIFASRLERTLQVWLAPRLYIIEWLVELTNGG